MHAGAICGCQEFSGRIISQLEQHSHAAGTRNFADDAEKNSQVMTNNESISLVMPCVVVRQTCFVDSEMALLQ